LVINKSTGKKFGKSEDGAVWLDPAKTPPNDFYQFWINCGDAGVEDYLRIYTMLDREEIEKIMVEFAQNKAGRAAQKALAYEVTKLVHGQEAANAAKSYAENLKSSAAEAKTFKIKSGANLVDVLCDSGLTSSKSEARQLLADNGVYINDVQAIRETLEESDFQNGRLSLRKGKKLQNTKIIELEA
jgi:tyrosyl-tRNA synthetase